MPRTHKSFAPAFNVVFNVTFALAAMLTLWVPTVAQPSPAAPSSAQPVAASSSGLLLSALA